jgi:PAS domain-containing protein
MLRPMRTKAAKSQDSRKVCHDVTDEFTAGQDLEHRRAEATAALRAEQARLEELFRLSPAFMAVLRGADHVFELVNDQYHRLIGHREIIGRRCGKRSPK